MSEFFSFIFPSLHKICLFGAFYPGENLDLMRCHGTYFCYDVHQTRILRRWAAALKDIFLPFLGTGACQPQIWISVDIK